jgi:hypothetical protein
VVRISGTSSNFKIAPNKKRVKINTSNKSGTGSKQEFGKVESGIYRQKSNGCYYEQPHINGRRTWRSLGTQNLKLAREEFHKRRVKGQIGYAPKNAVATRAINSGQLSLRMYSGIPCCSMASANTPNTSSALIVRSAWML